MSRQTMMFRSAAVAAAAAAVLAVTACGSSNDDNEPAATDAGAEAEAAGGLAGKTIGFSPQNLQADFFVAIRKQVEKAAAAQGAEVVVADPAGDAAKQLQQVQGWIQRKQIDALFMLPINPASAKTLLSQAQGEEIPAVVTGSPEDIGETGPQPGIAFMSTDWAEYGRKAGEEVSACIEERLGGSAEVAILGGPPLPGPVVVDRINAMKQAIEDGSPGAEIVAEADGQSQRLPSMQKLSAALQANPGIDALSGTSDDSVLGGVQALKQAGKDPSELCIVGLDGTSGGLAAVKDGTFYADVALDFATATDEGVEHLASLVADPGADGPVGTIPVSVVRP